MKCMMSESVKIIFYWAWLISLVWVILVSWLSTGWKYDVFFWYFILINAVTFSVIVYNVDVFNQIQTSIKSDLLSSKVELMLSLAILNRLKSFRWYFLMFVISWIYWKVELLQHVTMKYNNKFYWYVRSFHLTIYWQVFVLIYFNPSIFHNL